MHGLWRAELQGATPATATLLLGPNPNWADGLAGQVNRDGRRAQLAGDVEDGELTLEESADGERISASWLGDVVEGSCGREIRGTWQAEGAAQGQAEGAARGHAFVLRWLGPR